MQRKGMNLVRDDDLFMRDSGGVESLNQINRSWDTANCSVGIVIGAGVAHTYRLTAANLAHRGED